MASAEPPGTTLPGTGRGMGMAPGSLAAHLGQSLGRRGEVGKELPATSCARILRGETALQPYAAAS